MENFTPFASFAGGLLIGLSALMLLFFNGRIAGISGVLGGLLDPKPGESAWRVAFVGGLVGGGLLMVLLDPGGFAAQHAVSPTLLVIAGLLVGFGTRLGNGCTSGHGVCGLSRLSARSIVATGTFMVAAAVTVFIVHHVLGGAA